MTQQILNQVRSTVIGVGGFGLHTLVHLAPRLRFVNSQRRLANPNLPDLDKLVSYALVIPRQPDPTAQTGSIAVDGSIELWVPMTQNIQELEPVHLQEFWREVEDFTTQIEMGGRPEPVGNPHRARQCLDAAYEWWRLANSATSDDIFMAEVINEALIRYARDWFRVVGRSPLQGGARISRHDMLRSLEGSANDFGTRLEHQLGQALHDEHQYVEEEIQATTYLVASVCDDLAGVLLWPLAHILRRRLSEVPLEVVGLISTGPYSPPPYRAYEEASAYAGLRELDYLSRSGKHDIRGTPYESWQLLRENVGKMESPAFDRCYLLDAVKSSRATAASEHEVIVGLANALELFLIGNGDLLIQEQLAAGLSLEQRTTYSALGAAVKFLPIQKIQYWVTARLAAEIVDEHMLGIADDHIQAQRQQGDDFAVSNGLTLEGMGQAVSATVPIDFHAAGRGPVGPTFVMRDPEAILPRELQRIGRRRRRPPLVEWYHLVNNHRENLLINEQIAEPLQRVTLPPPNLLADAIATRQLGIWRLYMHLEGGTTEEIDLDSPPTSTMPGLYASTYQNETVLLTSATDLLLTSSPITSARVIPYQKGYLGLPVTAVQQLTRQTHRHLMRQSQSAGESERTIVERLHNQIVKRTVDEITSGNKGLQSAQSFLHGLLDRLFNELERLPTDDRAEQEFQEEWTRRRIALEQTLAGRPGPNGPETRGLAQRRPESPALIARAFVTATFLLFAFFAFLRRAQLVTLDVRQTAVMVAVLVLAPFALAGLFRLVYEVRAALFRRRVLALFREQINRQVTLSVSHAAEAVLRRLYDSISNLYVGLSRDIQAAELWRDENIGPRKFIIEEQSDTLLRQAIGDDELVSAVGRVNRLERDEKLKKIGNLWRWPENKIAALDAVTEALTAYNTITSVGQGATGAAATGQSPPQPPTSSQRTLIWEWLNGTVHGIAGRFVQRDTYKHHIETYIARHPRSLAKATPDDGAPDDAAFDSLDYLIDMGYLAKPYIFVEEEELSQPVVAIDLLGVNREESTSFDRQFVSDLRADHRWSTHPPRVVSTHDPFSLTYLRTLHGLPAKSLSRWERYRDAFANLEKRDRELLEVLPRAVYRAGEPNGKISLFFGFADELQATGHQPLATTGQTTP